MHTDLKKYTVSSVWTVVHMPHTPVETRALGTAPTAPYVLFCGCFRDPSTHAQLFSLLH